MLYCCRFPCQARPVFQAFTAKHAEEGVKAGALKPGTTAVDVLLQCARCWLDLFENVGTTTGPWRRKLWAMALTCLISSGLPPIVENLDEILNTVLDVLIDISRVHSLDPTLYFPTSKTTSGTLARLRAARSSHSHPDIDVEDDDEYSTAVNKYKDRAQELSGYVARRRRLLKVDPVVQENLQKQALEEVNALSDRLGPQRFKEAVLDVVEPTLLQELKSPPKALEPPR